MGNEILVSLGDSGLKDIAEVLGSRSCVRILDLLAVENLAVSDVARRLDMKINTADYNVKKLVKAGLIEKTGHWWSVKGKKMPVYQVVDRRIVISPRRKVAAKFLWVLGLTGVAGIWTKNFMKGSGSGGNYVMDATREAVVFDAVSEVNQQAVVEISSVGFWAGLAGFEWFLLGAWVTILLFFVYSLIVERRK